MINLQSILGLLKGNKYVGCDVGASYLKVVKLEKSEKGLSLLGIGMLKVPDILGDNERAIQIQSFLKQQGFIINANTAVNIEDPTLLIRRMDLPPMPERDMKTAIRWNFREFVDGSVDDCIVSYLPIKGINGGEKKTISAFCISRNAVNVRGALMKNAGLRLSYIEPNATALLAAFNNTVRGEHGKAYVVLDMGDAITNFVVIGGDCLLFSRPLANLNGRKLTELIAKALGVERGIAEESLKKYLARPVSNEAAPVEPDVEKINNVISDFISNLIVDIQRSIDAFCIMYGSDRVDKMYLCGGGICLPNIVNRLSEGLGVTVEIFNPFNNILNAETARQLVSASMYAVAVGLALPREN